MDYDQVASELAEIENLIVFAGAGVSLQTGAPSWKKLLESLINVSENYLDKKFCLDLKDQLKESDDLASIAQDLYNALKEKNIENIYFNEIRNALNGPHSDYTAQHIEIVRTINKIVTTNFDNGFEIAFETLNLENPTIDSLPSLDVLNLHNNNLVAYIHGKTDEKYIIFKNEDYEMYYPSIYRNLGSDDLETYLTHIYRNYTLIFVGFSFEDVHIRQFFKIQNEKIKNNDRINSQKPGFLPSCDKIKHYAFIKKVDHESKDYLIENYHEFDPDSKEAKKARELIQFDKLIKELEDINIYPYLYSEHKDWMICFRQLEKLKNTSVAELL